MKQTPNLDNHPIIFLNDLKCRFGNRLMLQFSIYTYIPNSRIDKRKEFVIPIDQVTNDWLLGQLDGLKENQDLALVSRVGYMGSSRKHHIPMLDFRGMTKGQLGAIMDTFPSLYEDGMHVYFSGRSFHAYFPQLLTHSKWVKFMGSSLLCNTNRDPSVVDQRWVGHRLMAGYSALRWSANGSHYKSYPSRVEAELLDAPYEQKKVILNSYRRMF